MQERRNGQPWQRSSYPAGRAQSVRRMSRSRRHPLQGKQFHQRAMGTGSKEEHMISRKSIATNQIGFSVEECEALDALRRTYHVGYGLFTLLEIERLRFFRWLIRSPEWDAEMDNFPPAPPQAVPTTRRVP
jgi:hypothetical protein